MKRLFLASMLATPLAVSGHHGWSEYDSAKGLKLTGKIVESGYDHPHGHIRFEAPGQTWTVTLAPGLSHSFCNPRFSMREGGASTTFQVFPGASKRMWPWGCS